MNKNTITANDESSAFEGKYCGALGAPSIPSRRILAMRKVMNAATTVTDDPELEKQAHLLAAEKFKEKFKK